ncbi:MAG: response regulator transcription factor [Ferruginibacter sp.]|nr:response regulator transcription factor [Ferruginibacter sp.]
MNISLIDDHILLIQAIKRSLLEKPGISHIATFSSARDFLNSNSILQTDVVLLDLSMPDMDGFELLKTCRKQYKNAIKTIILSVSSDVQTIRYAMQNGANGFLSKGAGIDEVYLAINKVANGEQYIETNLKESLVNSVITSETLISQLSPREKKILDNICNGKTLKEIAYDFKLSLYTVQYYYRCLMKKLKVTKTSELIVFAIKNGLYKPPDY